MTAVNLVESAEKLLVGIESTYGTAATTVFARHVNRAKITLGQTEMEDNGASARLFEDRQTTFGFKSGGSSIDFVVHAKPASALLDTAATPATPYLGTLLKAILGGEYNAAGSTVLGGASTSTVVNVQAGHGARFRAGTVVHIEVANVYYARVITSIATDALTVWPALPSAPASTDDVINSYTYFLTETNTQSLTVEHTFTIPVADAATMQRRLLGCTGEAKLEINRDNLLQFAFNLKAADWARGTLAVSTAVGTESMGPLVPVVDGAVYLQAAATTTAVAYAITKLDCSMPSGMDHLPCIVGDVQGTSGVARKGEKMAAEFTIQFRVDESRYTDWSAQNNLRMLAVFYVGSGTSRRCVSLFINRCQIVGVPNPTPNGGFNYYEVKLRPRLDTSKTVDTADGAPYTISLV